MRLFRPSSWKGLCAALVLLAHGPPAGAQESLLSDADADVKAPFDITADSVEYESERSVYVARGNVRITQPDRSLTADWVAFSSETGLGVATGSVVVVEGGDTLYADVLSFEVDTLRGIVFKGRLDARGSGFEMTGETIRKTGEQTYVFDDGTFTTCRCPEEEREPWLIRAKKADIALGGYATARNTSFDVFGIPVIWLPWMRYPVKTERETGFLLPTFSASSRSGGDIGIPFFWAALPNLNVTITPTYLFKRGFKPNVDIEYVFGERSAGSLYATFIDDKDIDKNDLDTPFDSERWAVEWIHDHFLPGGWRAKVDATLFSDNLFAFDFDDFSAYKDNRYLESIALVEKRFGPLGRYGFAGGVRWADDLQNPDDQDRDRFLLQRLPELQLTGLPQPLPGFASRIHASFDADYVHFYSQERAAHVYPVASVVGDDLFLDSGIDAIPDGYERDQNGNVVTRRSRKRLENLGLEELSLDELVEVLRVGPGDDVITREGKVLTAAEFLAGAPAGAQFPADVNGDNFTPPLKFGPENDGQFEEGEPLGDRGQRLVLNPRLSMPFRVADVVEVLPEFGYHGTFYNTESQGSVVRNLFTAMLDSRMRLRRVVDLPFGGGKAVHLMEPRVVYTGITHATQDGNPLFIPQPAVDQQRIRQFELLNITRDPSDRIESGSAVTVGLGNRFYVPGMEGRPPRLFADVALSNQYEIGGNGLRNFFVEGVIYPHEDIHVRWDMGYDPREKRLSEALVALVYSSEQGHDLGVSYRFLREIPRFFESFEGDENRYEEFVGGFQQINQLTLRGRFALTRNWALTYTGRYSFERSIFLTNRGGVEYISKCRCWAIRAEIANDRSGGVDFNLQYRLIGLGDDDVRPFGGGKKRASRDPDFEEVQR